MYVNVFLRFICNKSYIKIMKWLNESVRELQTSGLCIRLTQANKTCINRF